MALPDGNRGANEDREVVEEFIRSLMVHIIEEVDASDGTNLFRDEGVGLSEATIPSLTLIEVDKTKGLVTPDRRELFHFDGKYPKEIEVAPQEVVLMGFSVIKYLTYIAPQYDQSGAFHPEEAVVGITRKGFLVRVLIVLLVQIVLTLLFVTCSVLMRGVKAFEEHQLIVLGCFFGLDFIFYLLIHSIKTLRNVPPFNFISASLFTFTASYPVGYFYLHFHTPSMFFVSLAGALLIYVITGGLSTFCQVNFEYQIINALLIVFFLFFMGSLFFFLAIDNFYIIYTFLCVFIPIEGFLILHVLELTFGRGTYALKTNEYTFASIMIYMHLIIILVMLLVMSHGMIQEINIDGN